MVRGLANMRLADRSFSTLLSARGPFVSRDSVSNTPGKLAACSAHHARIFRYFSPSDGDTGWGTRNEPRFQAIERELKFPTDYGLPLERHSPDCCHSNDRTRGDLTAVEKWRLVARLRKFRELALSTPSRPINFPRAAVALRFVPVAELGDDGNLVGVDVLLEAGEEFGPVAALRTACAATEGFGQKSCATGRTTISLTSTSAGCSIA
jgi:hypothetical protein